MKEKLYELLLEWFRTNPSDYIFDENLPEVQLDGLYDFEELAGFLEQRLGASK